MHKGWDVIQGEFVRLIPYYSQIHRTIINREEVKLMAFKDIESLSTFLGDKEFMFGSSPTELDCTVFGMLAMVLHCHPQNSEFYLKITKDHQNLVKLADRIKLKYWPDWEQCIDKRF